MPVSISGVRMPRLRVLANGVELSGVISAEVVSSGNHSADRFRVQLVLSVNDRAAFAEQTSFLIEIQASFGAAWTSLVTGDADRIALDVIGGTISLEGRDLTARLISARTQESFPNHTASEIAALLAGRHGLVANVVGTSALVGRYYQSEHDRLTLDQFSRSTTEWDLLVFLAQQEECDVFIQGSVLYFIPTATSAANFQIGPGDCVDLRLERALSLAGDIQVIVKSWNSRQQTASVESAQSSSVQGSSGSSASQSLIFVRPNLTSDQAQQFAKSQLADLRRQERVMTASLPGELSMRPRDTIALSGTGTAFDQSYQIDNITRSIDVRRGFAQRVRAKNSSGTGGG
jgi:phage protein D